MAWVGTYDDIVNGREGQYRVRLMDNHHDWDCAYPGLELLPDGTFVTTTYGHWEARCRAVHRERAVHDERTGRDGRLRRFGRSSGMGRREAVA